MLTYARPTHGLLSYQCVLTTNLFGLLHDYLLNNIRAINRVVKKIKTRERERQIFHFEKYLSAYIQLVSEER